MKVSTFRADTRSIDKNTGEYIDPLMKWPLRGAAFTNEVGEALRPLIGEVATLCWVPALMYIGADIYDKYKNDKTEYSPNSQRLFKQAVFQGMASIFLPLVAVKAGQNLFSQFGRFGSEKVTFNIRERVGKIAENFIANGQMRAFHNKDGECIKTFKERVHNNIDFRKNEKAIKNPIVKLINKIEKNILKKESVKIESYAESTIKDLIEQRKKILNPTEEYKLTQVYKDYLNAIAHEQTESVAVKSALAKYQKKKMLKGRFIKTIGGFLALGFLIKPIDLFVENVLIGKVVGPGIDKIKTEEHKNKSVA